MFVPVSLNVMKDLVYFFAFFYDMLRDFSINSLVPLTSTSKKSRKLFAKLVFLLCFSMCFWAHVLS